MSMGRGVHVINITPLWYTGVLPYGIREYSLMVYRSTPLWYTGVLPYGIWEYSLMVYRSTPLWYTGVSLISSIREGINNKSNSLDIPSIFNFQWGKMTFFTKVPHWWS